MKLYYGGSSSLRKRRAIWSSKNERLVLFDHIRAPMCDGRRLVRGAINLNLNGGLLGLPDPIYETERSRVGAPICLRIHIAVLVAEKATLPEVTVRVLIYITNLKVWIVVIDLTIPAKALPPTSDDTLLSVPPIA